MTKKKRYTIENETFTIENKTVSNKARVDFKSLDMCYDRPSAIKQSIYDDWYNWFNTYGVKYMGHGIISHNCMQFTYAGYVSINGELYLAVITKCYNRLYKVVNAND